MVYRNLTPQAREGKRKLIWEIHLVLPAWDGPVRQRWQLAANVVWMGSREATKPRRVEKRIGRKPEEFHALGASCGMSGILVNAGGF